MKKNSTAKQPEIIIPSDIRMPDTRVELLRNGIKLYAVNAEGADVIRVSFVFSAGSAHQAIPFSASATANLLSEGTNRITAQQIAEKLDFYGLYYDVGIDRDYVVLTFCALTKFFRTMSEIAEEMIVHPIFPQHEMDTYCSKRKQQLSVERSKISFKVRELFAGALFGKNHPYGISFSEELYDSLQRDDIIRFFENHYTAENCFVVISGDIGDHHLERIAHIAERIPFGISDNIKAANRNKNITKIVHDNSLGGYFLKPHSEHDAFLQHEGAVQSAIRIGKLMFTRNHPDFIAMQITATILGGYFGSRLVKNLREERGYTYGIFATMVNMQHSGYLAIATEVAADATSDAITQIFVEINRLRNELVPQQELDMVKNIVVGEILRVLDGPFGIADVTIENVQNGDNNHYLESFIDRIHAITPEHIFEIANKYLLAEEFTVAVVGDKQPEFARV